MELLILRHAKSSWADDYTDDWERPLTERGLRDCAAVGHLLRTRARVPDLIVTSDAVRAQTTAHAVADAASYPGKIIMASQLYHAPPDIVIEVVQSAPDTARRLMIVAHNPGLEDVVAELTGDHVRLATATLVAIDVPVAHWRELDRTIGATVTDVWHAGEW